MTLLPPNATNLELALEAVVASRMESLPVAIDDTWSPESCPTALLPWLAWALDVDVWESSWDESTKRLVLADALLVHRRRGTRGALVRALAGAGLAPDELAEGMPAITYDGTHRHEGGIRYDTSGRWALYRLRRDIDNAPPWTVDQLGIVRQLAERVAPQRSELYAVAYSETLDDNTGLQDAAPLVTLSTHYDHDGVYLYDGMIDYAGGAGSVEVWA